MTTYSLDQAYLSARTRRLRKLRWWTRGISAAGLVVFLWLSVATPGSQSTHAIRRLYDALGIGCFVALVQTFRGPKSAFGRAEAATHELAVEVTAEEIRLNAGDFSHSVKRAEIVRAEESRRGLYLRTSHPFHNVFISRGIAGFQEIKDDVLADGRVKLLARRSPHWKGIFFVVLFCGTLVCDLLTSNRAILAVNLVVAASVALAGLMESARFRENRSMRIRVALGSLFPVAMTLLAIWFPFGVWP